MTRADRLCIKVALLPVATYVLSLLCFMLIRQASGLGPLPAGAGTYIPAVTLIVTTGAVGMATLLRGRLARSSD